MPSQIDFAIGFGLFIVFVAALFIYITSYLSSYTGLISSSELRTVAYDIHNTLFGNKGIPVNWEKFNYVPVKVGLISDLHRMPVVISEANNTDRSNATLNFSVVLDSGCSNKAWNNSIRIYNVSNVEFPFRLYNQSFCSQWYVNSTDIALNLSILANSNKTFFIYYSSDTEIAAPNYSIAFPINASNYSVKTYSEETLTAMSVSKIRALRNKSYSEVAYTLGTEYDFKIEVSES